MTNKFEAIHPYVAPFLLKMNTGAWYFGLGGSWLEDIKVFGNEIAERQMSINIFEKTPEETFGGSSMSLETYAEYATNLLTNHTNGYADATNSNVYAGVDFANCTTQLYLTPRDAFICLDSDNIGNFAQFFRLAKMWFPNGLPSNTITLLNTDENRAPGTALKYATQLYGYQVQELCRIPYMSRGKRPRIRYLTLWGRSDSHLI